jgi:DNA protecting protein DprA
MKLPMTETQARESYNRAQRDPKAAESVAPGTEPSPTKAPPKKTAPPLDRPTVEEENRTGVRASDLAALYALESIKGFGPGKFKEIFDAGLTYASVIADPASLPTTGKRGAIFRREIEGLGAKFNEFEQRAYRQVAAASRLGARIITYWNSSYPQQVLESNNAVPALYVIGSLEVLADARTVACVGSRNIRSPYSDWHREFARMAVENGFSIVSGFAIGADTLGHRLAFEALGKTICVMPSGLDRPFPPENRAFWKELSVYPKAALVSEFPFGTSASSLTLRKRNKLIVAFARGILMSQSSDKGGAMNAYRFALDLRRPFATFEPDNQSDTSGNRLAIDEKKGDVTALRAAETAQIVGWLLRLSPSI